MNYTAKTLKPSGKKVTTTTELQNGYVFELTFDIPQIGTATIVEFENGMYFQVNRFTRRSYAILINDNGTIETSASDMATIIGRFVLANNVVIN